MTYLLDTNVVSELRRLDRANARVVRWFGETSPRFYTISVITVLELERGMIRVQRRDPSQGGILRRWIENEVLAGFGDRILPVNTTIARRTAALHVPDPRPEVDALIAATALVHGLTVVTRNTADFEPMGVAVLNPWLENPTQTGA